MPRRSSPYPALGGWRFVFQGQKYWRATREEARVLLAELRGDATSSRPQPRTLAALVEAWEELHGSEHASDMLDPLVKWRGKKPLDRIGDDCLVVYHRYLTRKRKNLHTQKPLSRETVRKFVRYAGSVLRWGADQEWVVPQRKRPKLAKVAPRPKALSEAQLQALWASMSKPSARCKWVIPLARFILETGCRPGEARRLEWREVDLERRVVTIPEHKTAAKSGEARIFPLNDAATQIIEELPRRNPRYVFVSRFGKPYTRDGFGTIMQQHDCPVYRLRHTWCQRATEAGLSDGVILSIMGHASSAMLRMYRRITDAQKLAAAGVLDGLSQLRTPQDTPAQSAPAEAPPSGHSAAGKPQRRRGKTGSAGGAGATRSQGSRRKRA